VRTNYVTGRWLVFRYDLERPQPRAESIERLSVPPAVLVDLSGRGRRHDQPFLIGPDGRPDPRVNAFFASARMLARSPLTWSKYAQSIALWLNFLAASGQRWDVESEEDGEFFKEWRLSDARNQRLVAGSTFAANLAALRVFYRWAAARYGVVDPVAAVDDFDLRPHGVRDRRVKWLDPGGYRRWRDVGLRGLDLEGLADAGWRGRNEQRDAAFADGLYGSGLRLSEWASLLVIELPDDDPTRGYSTCRLADACAKGGYGHKFWLPRPALLAVLDYLEGARARAVRHAQGAGRYERVAHARLLVGVRGDRVTIDEPDGRMTHPTFNAIDIRARRRLFRRTEAGLEPLALWLNEDGLPRTAHAWQHTFTHANERIAALGLAGFSATPHMLRDSCALRWFAVGRLAYERRFAHLSEEEARDFRVQFGDTWDLVATILGHRSPETTKRHYLEPFRALDVELLLQHAQQAAVEGFLASYLADHPLVRTIRCGRPGECRFGRASGDASAGGLAPRGPATGARWVHGAVRGGEPRRAGPRVRLHRLADKPGPADRPRRGVRGAHPRRWSGAQDGNCDELLAHAA
jgi:integrase